jgi:hypothetical protein
MRSRVAGFLVGGFATIWTACAFAQSPSAPRIAPLLSSEWTADIRSRMESFAPPAGMPGLVATYSKYPALAEVLVPHLRYIWQESTLPGMPRQSRRTSSIPSATTRPRC